MKFETKEDRIEKLLKTISSVQNQHLDPSILDNIFSACRQEWDELSSIPDLPLFILKKYHKYINWEEVSVYHNFTLDELSEVEDYINWALLPQNLSLNEEMIRIYRDKLNWQVIVMQNELQNRDINFIREFVDKIDFQLWVRNKKVNESVIKEFKKKFDNLDWAYISKKLHSRFINKYNAEARFMQIYIKNKIGDKDV